MPVAWDMSNQNEPTCMVGKHLCWIRAGSPTLFVFRDGEYLGSSTEMKKAKAMAEKGVVADYVHKFPTTEEEFKSIKPKPRALTWKTSGKDTWTAAIEGEKVPARIRMLDKKTFVVYRNGNYLGGEVSREQAEMRVSINGVSQRNAVMRLWEQNHPGELPPFLMLTEEERRLYWQRNPAPRPSGRALESVGRPTEDPATRRLRDSLAQEGSAGKAGRAKLAKATGDSPLVPDGTIRVVSDKNPKKAGTGAHARWAKLFAHDGKTVKEYAEAGGNLTTLANAITRGSVSVEKDA